MTWKRICVSAAALIALSSLSILSARPQTEIETLFSAKLGENDVAYMSLAFSGVIVRTTAGVVIIDPADLLIDADIAGLDRHKIDAVIYTHGHGDHFNAAAARNLFDKTGAPIIAEPSVAKRLGGEEGIPAEKILVPARGQSVKAGAAVVRSVAGKHVGPIQLFQIKLGAVIIFHGGDSAYVPVADFRAQIAFLPTGQPSPNASPQDALRMALDLKPEVVVLMHGSDAQNADFEKLAEARLPGVTVEIPKPYKVKVVHLK